MIVAVENGIIKIKYNKNTIIELLTHIITAGLLHKFKNISFVFSQSEAKSIVLRNTLKITPNTSTWVKKRYIKSGRKIGIKLFFNNSKLDQILSKKPGFMLSILKLN